MVEENCTNIVDVSSEGCSGFLVLVIPYLDLVVVSSRAKHRLRQVKGYTSDRAWKSSDQ